MPRARRQRQVDLREASWSATRFRDAWFQQQPPRDGTMPPRPSKIELRRLHRLTSPPQPMKRLKVELVRVRRFNSPTHPEDC